MIAYNLAEKLIIDFAFNLGESSSGGDNPIHTIWVDNYGNPMRTNLGNILYFNTNEAA